MRLPERRLCIAVLDWILSDRSREQRHCRRKISTDNESPANTVESLQEVKHRVARVIESKALTTLSLRYNMESLLLDPSAVQADLTACTKGSGSYTVLRKMILRLMEHTSKVTDDLGTTERRFVEW